MISSLLWSLIKTLQGKLFLVGQNSRSLLTFYVKYMQVYTGIIFESRYIHIQIQCLREESAIYLLPTEYNSYQQSQHIHKYTKKKKNKALNTVILELPRGLSGKEPACLAGDTGSIPGPGRSPGGRNGNSFQHSCLGNPMDRGAWRATVFGGHKRVGHDLVTKHHYHL